MTDEADMTDSNDALKFFEGCALRCCDGLALVAHTDGALTLFTEDDETAAAAFAVWADFCRQQGRGWRTKGWKPTARGWPTFRSARRGIDTAGLA